MRDDLIKTALAGATDTKDVTIGPGVISSVDELFAASFGDATAVVVADENTFEVAGRAVQERLEAAGRMLEEPYVFPGKPTIHGDYVHIKPLIESLRTHDAIAVAVGAGSLNDIAKRASYECERPYMNVATAASMDGYTAFGAAISVEGYKQTLTCPAPRAVLADLEVLTSAPPDMTAAGYADLLAKITAGADWIVADTLEVEPIDGDVWKLVQGPLRDATANPAELAAGEEGPMDALIEGLIMSGLAMQAAASSRPASGAEHQFSHLWEMEGLGYDDDPPLSHGFKVGVGSISMAALYERLLERDLSQLDVDAIVSGWPSAEEVERRVRETHTTPGLDEAAVKEALAKYIEPDALRARLELLSERWPDLRERLQEQLMGADELRDKLLAAGCPVGPADIGLDVERFRDTYYRAQMIRRRYTSLDLANETGLLLPLVDELFADGGFWARHATTTA